MAGERWQQTKVDDMIRRGVLALNDGYRVRNVELGPVGIPFVRGGDIGDGGVKMAVEDHIRPEFTDRVQSKLTRAYDVAFITKGTVGRVGLVRPGQPPSVFAPQVCYWRSLDPDQLEPRFLYYLLTSAEFQANLDAVKTHGSMAADYVSMTDQRDFRLTFPPIREQKAIAAVLGALDDKIELNRRMNATLEAMARALFQSWFVDFDPVRAKLDGRPPTALDPASAALFPASFQESSLGPIPHGWEVCPLSEKIQLLSGGTPKTSEPTYWDGDIPWYSVRDAPSETDVWVIHTDKHVTKLGIANSAAQIFPEKTTIISARGTVGKLALTAVPMAMNQSCYGVRGITGYGDYFTYYSLREATAQLQQRTHGTVFDTITTETFKTLDCIFPTPKITVAFDRLVEPLLGRIRANLHQSCTLATLRDTLLPKLLSGELSVAQAAPAL